MDTTEKEIVKYTKELEKIRKLLPYRYSNKINERLKKKKLTTYSNPHIRRVLSNPAFRNEEIINEAILMIEEQREANGENSIKMADW